MTPINQPYLTKVHNRVAIVNDFVLLFHAILCVYISLSQNNWFPTITCISIVGLLWYLSSFFIKKKLGSKLLATFELTLMMMNLMLLTPAEIKIEYLFLINFILLIFYEDWRVILSFGILSLMSLIILYSFQNSEYLHTFIFFKHRLEQPFYMANQFLFLFTGACVCSWRAIVVKENQEELTKSSELIYSQFEIMTIHDLEMSQKVVQLEELTKKLNIANQELVNLSTVVQKTSNSVIITDAKGQIKWVNNGFENTTEYRLADVIGKKPGSFLQGKMTKIESISKIKKALLEKTSISEEILNYKKSGSPYWSALTITPIFDKKSKVVNYISIQSDITNLKIQQQKLEEYVFLNSHILRGSLCRVSGLAYLLSNDLAKDDFEIVIQKLVESMNEFDIITKEINVLLEDENYYEGKYLNLLENLKT